MNLWEWISTTTDGDALFTTLGLGVLAFLFARDLILTRGAHLRRVADLEAFHAKVLAEKEARLDDTREALGLQKEASNAERERADRATATMEGVADSLSQVQHVLASLDRALPDAQENEQR